MAHSNLSSFPTVGPTIAAVVSAVSSVDANPLADGLELATELLDSITTEGGDTIATG